jgi:hypothetical protein
MVRVSRRRPSAKTLLKIRGGDAALAYCALYAELLGVTLIRSGVLNFGPPAMEANLAE